MAFSFIGSSTRAQTPLTTLHGFAFSDGGQPRDALTLGSDGNFYGTTYEGGAGEDGGDGTAFRLTPAGQLTTLYNFNVIVDGVSQRDGYSPAAGLVQGSDGNFYGTTEYGGRDDAGTVFKLTPAGVSTTLHSFTNNDGSGPVAALIQGRDGNFYGTSGGGGANGFGTVFSITPAGVLTTLHHFSGADDGAGPAAALIQGSDGNFYGTTSGASVDGGGGSGTVFSITPAGVLTTLHSFGSVDGDGIAPKSSLVQGSDGNFYGTTSFGGVDGGNGVIFEVAPDATFSVLHTFDGEDGSEAQSLLQGSDGNFYGTTEGGGSLANLGTIFRLTPSGTLLTLYRFTGGADGANPRAGLIPGSDGNLYGTTSDGGADGDGTAFQFNPALAVEEALQTVSLAVGGGGKAQYGVETGKVIFQRTGDTSEALTVYYKVKGTAESGVDFKPLSGRLVIPAGQAQAKIKIKPLDDPSNTGKRKVKIMLLPPSDGSYVVGDPALVKTVVLGAE